MALSKVGFIIPCYNSSKFIENTYKKLSAQTYANMEFIFVDDGSTDNTYEFLKNFQERDERVVAITQKNEGMEGAIKNAINYITGDYTFLHVIMTGFRKIYAVNASKLSTRIQMRMQLIPIKSQLTNMEILFLVFSIQRKCPALKL